MVDDTAITTQVPCSLPGKPACVAVTTDYLGNKLYRIPLHICYRLPRDSGYGSPHNPEYGREVECMGGYIFGKQLNLFLKSICVYVDVKY